MFASQWCHRRRCWWFGLLLYHSATVLLSVAETPPPNKEGSHSKQTVLPSPSETPEQTPKEIPTVGQKPAFLPPGPTTTDYPHLHNLLRVTDRIYSGGEPKGTAAFAELAKLGIKTVVSVDGAVPDLAQANQVGLRYVHIPIGYNGIPRPAGLALARLLQEESGPIYIHCHHGQHRGPAAAAVACILAGAADSAAAAQVLRRADTSPKYAGLWRDVAQFQPPKPEETLPLLVAVAPLESLPAAMAQLDRAFDELRLCQKENWQPPVAHPDLVPTQLALLLREGFRESGRHLPDTTTQTFRAWLAESEQLAEQLERALETGDTKAADQQVKLLKQRCDQCHQHYRDQPQQNQQ